jgi:hypothetical protein
MGLPGPGAPEYRQAIDRMTGRWFEESPGRSRHEKTFATQHSRGDQYSESTKI